MTISTLIDKQDNAEIIRDEIAAILTVESASQMALAAIALKDPELWRLRVFKERANPWEAAEDRTPIVNVWWETASVTPAASNTVERQSYSGQFNIDVYGFGLSRTDGAGHIPGDQDAALEAQRAVRLVRNILQAATYTYLNMRGVVGRRMVETITIFQPQQDNQNVAQVVGARLSLRVDFNEFSPQVVGEPLELLTVRVKHLEDGEVVLNADYDYTT